MNMRDMITQAEPGDKVALYLQRSSYNMRVVHGMLEYRVRVYVRGKHNLARTRMDVWFKDHLGNWWWGVAYGDGQLCHCRKLKHDPNFWWLR